MGYSVKIKDAIEVYIKDHELDYGFQDEDDNIYFYVSFVLDDGAELEFGIAVLEDGAVSYALLPQTIPYTFNGLISEYLHRANYGLLSGNFEFDYDEGRIQYKTFASFLSEEPKNEEIEGLFLTPLVVISRYIKGIDILLSNPKVGVKNVISKIEV